MSNATFTSWQQAVVKAEEEISLSETVISKLEILVSTYKLAGVATEKYEADVKRRRADLERIKAELSGSQLEVMLFVKYEAAAKNISQFKLLDGTVIPVAGAMLLGMTETHRPVYYGLGHDTIGYVMIDLPNGAVKVFEKYVGKIMSSEVLDIFTTAAFQHIKQTFH